MTILLRFMLAVLLALPLAFPHGALAQEYRIQAGDRLTVEVLEDASLNRTLVVLPGGTVDFPYAGSIRVAGQSPTAVGSQISQALAGVLASPPTVFVTATPLIEPILPTAPVEEEVVNIYIMGEASARSRVAVGGRKARWMRIVSML